MKYLNQDDATNIDLELITEHNYTIEQLIEMGGMSCAHAISKCYELTEIEKRLLICCGPGNNGGFGLVCARHLAMLGYQCTIYYPCRNSDESLYRNLVGQCSNFGSAINFIETCPSDDWDYSLMVDALFGYGFKPPVREAFLPIVRTIEAAAIPIISIDIPSGWHVESGPQPLEDSQTDRFIKPIKPELLISLIAPKLCAKHYTGKYHYLGGRFVPPPLQDKYKLNLIEYPDTECVVAIPMDVDIEEG